MPKPRDQRVGVFVDIQNMYYSAKQFYNQKVNFAYILNRAVSGRSLVRAIAYVIKADIKEEENFFDALEKIGYDVRSKDLQTFYGGAKKGDWDVGIAMDIMRMASKLDVVVLVSGDGDFKDLIEHVKALGCRAEVIAFRKTASSRILSVTDEFIDLDKELDKVLIKDMRQGKPKQEFQKKEEFQKRDNFQRGDNFQKNNNFQRREPFQKRENHFEQREPVSLIQKLNMEQPLLARPVKAPMALPVLQKDVSKIEKPAEEKKEPAKEEKKEEKREEKKEEPRKKGKKDKQESMLKRVISKVTRKK